MIRQASIVAVVIGGMVALTAHVVSLAQSPRPTFEVNSVKPGIGSTFPVGPQVQPGGTFVAINVALGSLIRFAYNLPDYQLVGGPAWVRIERFDVHARAGRDVTVEEARRMLQTLLADRFHLVVHHEQREMAVYTLRRIHDDGRLGPNLRRSPADCASVAGRGRMEERRTPNGGVETRRTCAPIASVISSLSSELQGPVHDQTALTGLWDSELSFTGERRRNADPAAVARDPNNAPALFTAVQEQLGLKLEPSRAPVDVLVIDSVERPTPD